MSDNLNRIKKAMEESGFFDSDWSCQAHSGDGKWSNWWDMKAWSSKHRHMVSAEAYIDKHDNILVKFNLSLVGLHLVSMSSIELCLPNQNLHRVWLEMDSIGSILSNACNEIGTPDIVTASSMQELKKMQKARRIAKERYAAEAKAENPEFTDAEAQAIARVRWRHEQKCKDM